MISLTFMHLIIILLAALLAAILIFFTGQLIGYLQGIRDTNTELNAQLHRFKRLKILMAECQQYKDQPQEQRHD